MILSDINYGNRIGINTNGTPNSVPINNAPESSNVLSSLRPGDEIQAKVVSRDGDNVRLELDGKKFVDAKISGGINLEAGKNVVFEVRSTSSGVTLSPLFTNLSQDPNISKALSMAGLPLNSDTMIMTKSMMQAGMGIDRASLVNMFKDLAAFPDARATDIVDLHRLGLEVNETNIEQMDSYKNLSYQLGEGMNDVADKVTELVEHLIDESNTTGNADSLLNAAKVFEGIVDIASEHVWDEELVGSEEDGLAGNDKLNSAATDAQVSEGVLAKGEAQSQPMSAAERALKLLGAMNGGDSIIASESENASNSAGISGNQGQVSEDTLRNELTSVLRNLTGDSTKFSEENVKNSSTSELLNNLKHSLSDAIANGDTDKLSHIFNNTNLKNNVMSAVRAQWSITPSEVADKNNVKEMYNRLQRQLDTLNSSLESAGLKNTDAGNAAGNMSNNLDFLNQVNQMYAYIQLPLKLSTGDDAHGDLYVYSNGKKISAKDGKVTALLHLDMEHLGPLDVYVAMDTSSIDKKVTTQFTVADDEVLDLLSLHMDELTKRLESKGYSCTAKFSLKGEQDQGSEDGSSGEGGIRNVLAQTGSMKLAEYSFDVRT